MTCDRDDPGFPSPCCRTEVQPPPTPRAVTAARECEDSVLALLTAPTLPPDAVVLATLRRARALLREAAAGSPR